MFGSSRGRVRLAVAGALALAALGLSGLPASADGPTSVRINEVESSGGSPGDWVELVNTGATAVDLSGWVVKDNDDSHVFTIASGTSLAAGGRVVVDVESAYGLGSSDSVRLYQSGGTTLIDSYTWTSHASTTYGRCPDGTGSFATTLASTRGATNSCSGSAWPGDSAVAVADATNVFGSNLSGVSFQSSSVLWAVKNGTGTLYRLVPSGSTWIRDTTGGWSSGKVLHYANGSGDPDAEGVVVSPDGVLVATERNNSDDNVSLLKVLRYDGSSTATSLNATAEWNLTADLPSSDPNSGLESIAWVPDTYLTAHGFRDEHTNSTYNPANYAGHGTGLYFVGLESNGTIYAYALDQAGGGYTRVATFGSGLATLMDLEFDAVTGHLWAVCDNTCAGRATTSDINGQGQFAVTATYQRPTGMGNYNNEGFAISPQACAAGRRPVIWADDSNDASHALRSGTLTC
ncbi:Lamin Tail Domain [Parafrankia irregularis]|uniref:Lamin Tail Domain n=1 Tax=Parafrankia irregularis TaxID=795642 RepID=A0A0S4QLR6_9ACTN|nr:lamin tail domain-containing protein [Parafrankia sp. CH37]CUU55999.1 Lamin Tail Domain [Parafrankia irregularis]